MNPELLKLRLLPMPRWILGLSLVAPLLVGLIVLAVQPSTDDAYRGGPTTMATFAVMIGALVFGAWMFGVEFGQGTMRRTITAEPRRGLVLTWKLLTTAAAAAVFAAVAMGFSALVAITICAAHGVNANTESILDLSLAVTLQAPLIALIAAAFTLVFRSFAGGLVATFAMIFVVDGVLRLLLGKYGDYTFGTSLVSIMTIFDETDQSAPFGLAQTLLIALGWIAAIASPGAYRFIRGDFK
ncbi:MAG: ABC transporter permease subunit [Actinobacteria bacterium]|nr:ABC transporter permease subunit [Actinomycetota bacterium]